MEKKYEDAFKVEVVESEGTDRLVRLIQDKCLMLSGLSALIVLKEKFGFNQAELNRFAELHNKQIDIQNNRGK